MKAVADTLGVARSHLAERLTKPSQPRGPYRKAEDAALLPAIREIARDRNWKEIDSDVRREGNDRIVIRMRGERKGDDRERRCVYNTRSNQARFDDHR